MEDEKRVDLAFRGNVGYGIESALMGQRSIGFPHRYTPNSEYPHLGPLAVFRPERADRSFAATDAPASPQDKWTGVL